MTRWSNRPPRQPKGVGVGGGCAPYLPLWEVWKAKTTVWWVNFRGIVFREKSKEGSRSNFHGFNFRDCRTVGHAHRV